MLQIGKVNVFVLDLNYTYFKYLTNIKFIKIGNVNYIKSTYCSLVKSTKVLRLRKMFFVVVAVFKLKFADESFFGC